MMKDNILKSMLRDNENSARPLDRFEFPMEGYLKIVQKDSKTGEIIHADEDHNTVLIWARHATFHCLTGSPFSNAGVTRSDDHSLTRNGDATLISGEQFFQRSADPEEAANQLYYWDESKLGGAQDPYVYSYYPTKILFGTGCEFESWDDLLASDANYAYHAGQMGYNSENFDEHIGDPENDYCANWKGNQFVPTRSIDDIYTTKINSEIKTNDRYIKGAVKTLYKSSNDASIYLDQDDDGYYQEKPEYKGVGKPCFIYSDRSSNGPEVEGSGVYISRNSDIDLFDNRLSFTFTMPDQDEEGIAEQNKFYPYNNYLLKEAGLFCDSFLLTNSAGSFVPDLQFPYGMIFCKRYISPFTKTGSSSVSVNWVLYY